MNALMSSSSTDLLFVLVLLHKSLELSSVCNSGGLAHAIDDGRSLDMVVLVLQNSCVKSLGPIGKLVAVKVGGGDFAFFVSSNFRIDARHR